MVDAIRRQYKNSIVGDIDLFIFCFPITIGVATYTELLNMTNREWQEMLCYSISVQRIRGAMRL